MSCTFLCNASTRHRDGPTFFLADGRFRVGTKKKLIVSRQPIFVNLKSNTMKNTVQI